MQNGDSKGASHTPGPWFVSEFAGALIVRADLGDGESVDVAALMDEGSTEDVTIEANARLIAAAPELLDALRRSLWLIEVEHKLDGQHITRDARAAIAKAEGR